MRATAILFCGPGEVAFEAVEVPEPAAGEVLIRTAFSGVSPGTELRCLAGRQPGLTTWPFIPGYSLAGLVERAGPGTHLSPGTRVFTSGTQKASVHRLWGGHCSLAVCDESKVLPLPDNLPLPQAAMLKLAAISAHGVQLSDPQPGERVAVVGLGPIGLVSALLHQARGAEVVATDLHGPRRDRARAFGLRIAEPADSLTGTFTPHFVDGADIVVDSTGAPNVVEQSLELLSSPAWDNEPQSRRRLLVQGSYSDQLSFDYQKAFLRQAEVLFPRDAQRRDLDFVAQATAAGVLDLSCLLEANHPSAAAAAQTYRRLQENPGSLISTCFRWP